MLFDVGPYGDVWLDNAERLVIDLSAIDTVFLSHWPRIDAMAAPWASGVPGAIEAAR